MRLVTRDALAAMRDDSIFNTFNALRRKLMDACRNDSRNTSYIIQLETELNYIQRELEVRDNRRRAHMEYMQARSNQSRHNS